MDDKTNELLERLLKNAPNPLVVTISCGYIEYKRETHLEQEFDPKIIIEGRVSPAVILKDENHTKPVYQIYANNQLARTSALELYNYFNARKISTLFRDLL